MAKVAIEKDMLLWAIHRCRLEPADLQKKFPKIQEWFTGEVQPTLKQLQKFAEATLTPLGFLFLKDPPQETLPIPFFRTYRDEKLREPSIELMKTIRVMQMRQDWMSDYLKSQGEEPLSFINSAKPDEADSVIAEKIRDALGLQEEWAEDCSTWSQALGYLHQTMESAGILVVINGVLENNTHRKLDPGEFKGFVLIDDYAPLVFINGADYKTAQMFTLAHELAHIFLGKSAIFDLYRMQPADEPVEKKCNQVAAEFLVPGNKLQSLWEAIKNNPDSFQVIARQFKVSSIVAARRLLDLNLIDKKKFFAFYEAYIKDERYKSSQKTDSGGNYYNTQNTRIGKLFASAVITAAKRGDLLYSDAYKLTGLNCDTFQKYTDILENKGEA